jgi:putative sigma-54 modulation protein
LLARFFFTDARNARHLLVVGYVNQHEVPSMTIETRQLNLPFSEALRAFVEHRVQSSLRRHVDRVSRVRVRVGDVNGPRHGVADKVCCVEVELDHTRAVFVRGFADDIYAAVTDAAHRVGRAVDRRLGRLQLATH